MKKRLLLFTFLINSILFSTFAVEESKKGIEFYKFGAMEPAKLILLDSYKNSNANKAEIGYYLGEIYFTEGKKDSASYYFKEGLAANPDYVLNEVGLAKLQLKGNPTVTEASLKKIADKNKKKTDVLVAIAKAYFQNGMNEKALEYTAKAKKVNSKYAETHVLEGDIYAASKDYGKASQAYDQALYFDPNCKEAYVRYADIYSTNNPKYSIEILERLVALDPSSPLAQRAVGDAYFNAGQFGKAIAAYSKYAASEYSSSADLSKYASILFYSGDYEKSSEVVLSALKKTPDDFVMNRLLMYNLFEQKKYTEGLAVAEKFMNMKGKLDFIYLDYVYYGRLLQKEKKMTEALAQFEKAREMDSTKTIINKELAELYESMGEYDKAIAHYEIFLKEGGDQVKTTDHFALGRYYYSAGTAIKETNKESHAKKIEYLTKADGFFAYVAEKSPSSYLGNLWRARANSAIDPESEQGIAKPYYEAALVILNENSNKNVKEIIECYRYLGYYYLIKKDNATSKSYWNKILELDPTNETAIQALKAI